MGTRGVWSLENVEIKYPVDDWVSSPSVWFRSYDIAHSRPYPAPNLQRWNLGTATMSNSTLSCSRYWGQASGNTTFSYFASGDVSPGMTKKTNTDKLSYSPYTLAATPTANLTNGIDRGGASSSNLAAYFSTGYPTGSWVDKILFATDTKSTLSDDFGGNYMTFSSLADGVGGGYLFESGGNLSGSKTFKITYSTDGLAHLPGSNLVNYTSESNGEMMSHTAGYKSGGANPSPAATSITNKLTYSNTTWSAVPGGGLPIAKRRAASGTGRSKGFVGGGDLNVAPVYSDFALLDFSTDTYAQEPALNFSPSSYGYYPNKSTTTPLDGLYGAPSKFDRSSFWSGDLSKRWIDNQYETTNSAYFHCPSPANSVNKVDMGTDTASALSGDKEIGSKNQCATGGNVTKGYIFGGNSESRVGRLTYSSETGEYPVPGGQMTQKRRECTGMANDTNTYISGGFSHGPGPVTNISSTDKFTHSTESSALAPGLNSYPGGKGSGSGNQTVGYWVNGLGSESRIYKVTYATDTGSNPLNCGSPGWGGRYNARFGGESPTANYCIGGAATAPSPGVPNADRYSAEKFPFATETSTRIPGADTALTSGAYRTSGAGKDTTGYVVEGNKCQKFDYATDTQVSVFDLSNTTSYGWGMAARRWLNPAILTSPPETTTASTMAVANPSVSVNGYFYGGTYPIIAICDKFTFSNETAAAAPGSNYPNDIMGGGSAVSSTTKGYQLGGLTSHESNGTNNAKAITYSNDTWASLPGSAEPQQSAGWAAGSNSETAGYQGFGGNGYSPKYSYMNKLTFSNDTKSNLPNAPRGEQVMVTGIGHKTSTYWWGGYTPNKSTISKLVHSTDTQTVISATTGHPGGARSSQSAGNNDYGYFMGYAASPNKSDIDKITYSTDTCTVIPADMPQPVNSGCAISSVTAGYVSTAKGGGPTNSVYKFVFSTETASTNPSSLSSARYNGCQTGAASNGNAFSPTPVLI